MGLKAARAASADVRATLEQMQADIVGSNRAFTAEERAAFQHLQSFSAEVAGRRATVEAQNEDERNWRGGPLDVDPDQAAADAARAAAGLPVTQRLTSTGPSRDPRSFSAMFSRQQLSSDGFQSADEFLATIHLGVADSRLRATTGTTGSSPDGGFAVPNQFFSRWLDSSLEGEIVRPRADIRPMSSKTASVAAFDDADRSSTLYGGFAGGWAVEGEELDVEIPKLRGVNLDAKKLGILARVSNELAADGVSYEAQLEQAIIKALGFFLDRAFLTGLGTGQPLGVINAGGTVVVEKESGQLASTILYRNVINMLSRLMPGSFTQSVWVCSQSAIPELMEMSVAIGTGGSHVPALINNNGQFTLLTRPVVFTEKVPGLGTKGDIGLFDFSHYLVGLRADMSLARSFEAGFTKDVAYYRGIIRVDGAPKLNTPVTPAGGGPTVSPFVVLEDRT
jgi:HK97 family phage major capsid protein